MVERRKNKRSSVAEPVIIAWDRGDVVGELRNVSPRGMFIALAHASAEAGTKLVVRLGPRHPHPAVDLAGVVRWVDREGLGVELADGDLTERFWRATASRR